MFKRILIANRGEIACRIIKTARRMGIETVAVYSEADRDALHVEMADEAVAIGPPAAAQSYLLIDKIVEACKATGAQAVHPGYGFLSEREAFPVALAKAGIVFIGPNPKAIAAMGDKIESKKAAAQAKVSTVPGHLGVIDDDRHALKIAEEIGFPVMIKASAGGGGKGMRIAHSKAEVAEGFVRARSEAKSSFGDDRVFIEKFIVNPRHIEIQVLGDKHGNVIYLGERECSIQRRNQKVVEEAPSPLLDEATRRKMGEQAVALTKAVGYDSAGTVEFVAGQDRSFYFLEMNTRLQVEHPVTELVTGLDLVRLQLSVAAGEPLPLSQAQLTFSGHAIEARLYAEDPARGFAPQTGQVLRFDAARACAQPGVRIDSGVEEGSAITPFYDGLLAKIVAHGANREEARRKLLRALAEATLFGLPTNAGFLRKILQSDVFAQGALHSALIDGWLADTPSMLERPAPTDELWALAACVLAEGLSRDWLRPSAIAGVELTLSCDGSTRRARFERDGGTTRVRFAEGATLELRLLERDAHDLRYEIGTLTRRVACLRTRDALHLGRDGSVFVFREPSSLALAAEAADPRRVLAPLAGVLGRLAVAAGDEVRKGHVLLVIEAMKMETRVAAGVGARVVKVHRRAGDQVAADELLVELEPLPEES
jgi:propionyl-CoA carboxylase alpha chain